MTVSEEYRFSYSEDRKYSDRDHRGYKSRICNLIKVFSKSDLRCSRYNIIKGTAPSENVPIVVNHVRTAKCRSA